MTSLQYLHHEAQKKDLEFVRTGLKSTLGSLLAVRICISYLTLLNLKSQFP